MVSSTGGVRRTSYLLPPGQRTRRSVNQVSLQIIAFCERFRCTGKRAPRQLWVPAKAGVGWAMGELHPAIPTLYEPSYSAVEWGLAPTSLALFSPTHRIAKALAQSSTSQRFAISASPSPLPQCHPQRVAAAAAAWTSRTCRRCSSAFSTRNQAYFLTSSTHTPTRDTYRRVTCP